MKAPDEVAELVIEGLGHENAALRENNRRLVMALADVAFEQATLLQELAFERRSRIAGEVLIAGLRRRRYQPSVKAAAA